jgi:hypothetical protein
LIEPIRANQAQHLSHLIRFGFAVLRLQIDDLGDVGPREDMVIASNALGEAEARALRTSPRS